jgi:hypothetical protein
LRPKCWLYFWHNLFWHLWDWLHRSFRISLFWLFRFQARHYFRFYRRGLGHPINSYTCGTIPNCIKNHVSDKFGLLSS